MYKILQLLWPLTTSEERKTMPRKVRALKLFTFFLTASLIAVLVFAVTDKASSSTSTTTATSPKIELTKTCYVQHNVDHNCFITKMRARHHRMRANFRHHKYGRAHGFHPSRWLYHYKAQRRKFVGWVKAHPRRVPHFLRGSKAATAAWLKAVHHASCVWPSHYPKWYHMGNRAVACTGMYATGGHFLTKKRWRIIGFTVCEGTVGFLAGRGLMEGANGMKFDKVGFGVGSVPCFYGTVDDSNMYEAIK